ncbi:hypothetical protein [Fusobacterium sp.]|nr:hypothetical protein [Fusobacterium sp.]
MFFYFIKKFRIENIKALTDEIKRMEERILIKTSVEIIQRLENKEYFKIN